MSDLLQAPERPTTARPTQPISATNRWMFPAMAVALAAVVGLAFMASRGADGMRPLTDMRAEAIAEHRQAAAAINIIDTRSEAIAEHRRAGLTINIFDTRSEAIAEHREAASG